VYGVTFGLHSNYHGSDDQRELKHDYTSTHTHSHTRANTHTCSQCW